MNVSLWQRPKSGAWGYSNGDNAPLPIHRAARKGPKGVGGWGSARFWSLCGQRLSTLMAALPVTGVAGTWTPCKVCHRRKGGE